MKHVNNWEKFNEIFGWSREEKEEKERQKSQTERDQEKKRDLESDTLYNKIKKKLSSVDAYTHVSKYKIEDYTNYDIDFNSHGDSYSGRDTGSYMGASIVIFDDGEILVKIKMSKITFFFPESIKVKTTDSAIKLIIDKYEAYVKEIEENKGRRKEEERKDFRRYDSEIDESRKFR